MAHHLLIFIFGILGNIVSFMVYLAPAPTFWSVYKQKSTQGYQSLPYVCAIFSSMLWIYYALVKTNSFLLITINCAGCVIETVYIVVFLIYAPKKAKMGTAKLLVLLNLVGFSAIVFVSNYLAKASIRAQMLGWICVAFSVIVFAAPLSIIRTVIRTKSVEFMPFPLSFSLTLSAVMWFMYGLLQKDMYIVLDSYNNPILFMQLPNVLGFTFGVAQMVLYAIYRNKGKVEDIEMKFPAESKANVDTNVNKEQPSVCAPSPIESVTKAEVVDVANEKVDDEFDLENNDDNNQVRVHVEPSSCADNEIGSATPSSTMASIPVINCAA